MNRRTIVPVEVGPVLLQLVLQQPLLKELLFEPERQRHAKGGEPSGRECQIGLDQPLELQKRLVVERDIVDIARLQPRELQAEFDRMRGETGIMLDAREALFLCRCDDFSVFDQGRSGIMVVG